MGMIGVSDNVLQTLQRSAEEKGVSIEHLVDEILQDYVHRQEIQEPLPERRVEDILSPEELAAYPEWLRMGLFASGRKDTGSNADEILAAEWNPDDRS